MPTRAFRRVVRLGWVCVLFSAIRRLSRRSGATDEEYYGSLPGDDVLPHPMIEWTRAATIRTGLEQIWPWLVQMGYGRGGWYTSERFDRIVWRIENRSSDEILPEWQHLEVGDIVPDGPDYAAYFRVAQIIDRHAIVYRSIRHPYRGHPVDPSKPADVERVEQRLMRLGVYLDFSWAFVLIPVDRLTTRLIIRTRANVEPQWTRLAEIPLGLVDLYHVSTMFRGLARRVERGPTPTQPCEVGSSRSASTPSGTANVQGTST